MGVDDIGGVRAWVLPATVAHVEHLTDRVDIATAGGVWRVGSGSGVHYYLDLRGDRPLFLRDPGNGGTPAGFDGVWVPLG